MKKIDYEKIFKNTKKIAEEAEKTWTEEQWQNARANIQIIESTYTEQPYLTKKRIYFEKKKN